LPRTILGANQQNLDIDAGLLGTGLLQINKAFAGVGVSEFAGGDTLEFTVSCTLPGERDPSLLDTVTLQVADASAPVLSEELGPYLAGTQCDISESDSGHADEAATTVSVTIPWLENQPTGAVTIASLTNRYSAGTIALTKNVQGAQQAIEAVKNAVYQVQVTCELEEPSPGGTIRATVYSGVVKIKAGQTKQLMNAAGDPQALPLGSRCWGEEVDAGAAVRHSVDFDSYERAVEVVRGDPTSLQQLELTATNIFECNEELCPTPTGPGGEDGNGSPETHLANTGSQMWGVASIAGALLLAAASVFMLRKKNVTR
jgi:LPXTG-motif cell wall-anchored protein